MIRALAQSDHCSTTAGTVADIGLALIQCEANAKGIRAINVCCVKLKASCGTKPAAAATLKSELYSAPAIATMIEFVTQRAGLRVVDDSPLPLLIMEHG